MKIEEELITGTIIENSGERDLEDVRVNVLIADLGVWRKVGPFDIEPNDQAVSDVLIELPNDAPAGRYDARITISNNDMRRVVYRQFDIMEE